jgi:hypothetical protein
MNARTLFAGLIAILLSMPAPAIAQTTPREEKTERVLIDLYARCRKMLVTQTALHGGIKKLHALIEARRGKMPSGADRKNARKLAQEMAARAKEAAEVAILLEKDGAAVAFPELFRQLRDDMILVQRRLEKADAGKSTQAISRDIIDTLMEMLGALGRR